MAVKKSFTLDSKPLRVDYKFIYVSLLAFAATLNTSNAVVAIPKAPA
jgi:hypothetical protein